MAPFCFGIVGGGVSGCAILNALVKKIAADDRLKGEGATVHLWEVSDTVGPGLCWGNKNSDCQLFNLPAGAATLSVGQYGDFLKYCGMNRIQGVEFISFPPRNIFGGYVNSVVNEACDLAKQNNISVKIHTCSSVVDMLEVDDSQQLLSVRWTEESSTDICSATLNAAFLCTGPASTSNTTLNHLPDSPKCIKSPFPYTNITDIPTTCTVGVVGTGLTAVDVVKQLKAQGHSGTVTMASRSGLLPTVKARAADPFRPLTICTRGAVQSIVDVHGNKSNGLMDKYLQLLCDEMEKFDRDFCAEQQAKSEEKGGDSANPSPASAKAFQRSLLQGMRNGKKELAYHIAQTQQGSRIPWQDCVIALTIQDVLRVMYNSLCDAEKKLFFSRYQTLSQVYLNSMPESSAMNMQEYIESGWCVLSGGLAAVDVCGTGFKFEFSGAEVEVDYVIDATGFSKHFTDTTTLPPLYCSMLASGLVEPCQFGGLECNFETCRMSETSLLYGTGHTISGVKCITSGLGYCVGDGTAAVADALVQWHAAL